MRAFTPKSEPSGLQQYRADGGSYAKLPRDLRDKMLAELRAEQNERCAYCCRELAANVRIEHFHPQSQVVDNAACKSHTGARAESDVSLTWANLLLCCCGDEGSGKDTHCDVTKKDTDICRDFPNPKTHPTKGLLFRAKRDGTVVAGSSATQHVIDKVLCLNCRQLASERKAQLTERWQRYLKYAESRGKKSKARAALLAKLGQQPHDIHDLLFADWLNNDPPD